MCFLAIPLILAISFYVADCTATPSIIFVAPPISADNYYDAKKADLYDYYANFIDIVNSRHLSSNEYVLALVDEYGEQQLLNRGVSPFNIFKNTNYPIADIWIRDFGTIQVDDILYKFLYRPNYLSLSDARYIDNNYRNWLDYHSVAYVDVDIILDGGNFVYERNTKKLIVTTRILDDNPTYDKLSMIQYLKDTLNINYVAIIEQDAVETTGHSDGIVTFINDDVIGINDYSVTSEQTFYDQIVSELISTFGEGFVLVDLPYDPTDDTWLDFYSAKGVYTNILTSLYTHYVPSYTSPYDGETVALLSQYTANDVDVQPVDATNVAIMGGAVRCLTWYIWGVPAVEFIAQHNILPSDTYCNYQKKYKTTWSGVGKTWTTWYDAKVRKGRNEFLAEYPWCGDAASLELFYQFVYDESARTLTFYAKVCCGTDKRFGGAYQVKWVPNDYGSKSEYVPNQAWIDHNTPLYDYTCKYKKDYEITLPDKVWPTWQQYCNKWIDKGRDSFLDKKPWCGYEDSLEFFYRFSYDSNAKRLTFYGHFCCGKENGQSLQFGAAYTKSGKIPNQVWYDHNPWAYEQECIDQTDWA